MKYSLTQAYKDIAGKTEYLFGSPKKHRHDVLICAMHSVPRGFLGQFSRLIEWLCRNYVPLRPSDLPGYRQHPEEFNEGPYFLLTFDDGLKNNLAAAEVMATYGIQGIFFLVPEFLEAKDPEAYYLQYIRPFPDYRIDKEMEDRSAMHWDDVRRIMEIGHTIGSHTLTHRLTPVMSKAEWTAEIVESKSILEEKLNCVIAHFASPNNTLLSTNNEICGLIHETYTWHHTTLPGIQEEKMLQQGLLYRRNIEVHWPGGITKFSLGNFDLPRWKTRRDALSLLVQPPRP